ncbi:hypothetical protein Syun_001131 [Stephania yunnanensis]|uniref:Ribonuclease H1 N-terminal domain-containing protein n=1 Tax=Stephania yunnanensis TaxID=152371 RepID=A0AAP0LDI3_9MAGN
MNIKSYIDERFCRWHHDISYFYVLPLIYELGYDKHIRQISHNLASRVAAFTIAPDPLPILALPALPRAAACALPALERYKMLPARSDMRSNWKWYTVFRGWDPGVYGTWYECYKQGIKFDMFYYAHFDTKEEAIADFDRYNHTATIAREVHDQLTLEEALAKLDDIPPPPLPPRMWIEELYEAKGVPLPRSPSFDEEPPIDLFPRDRTLYQRVGSWWSD